MKVSVTQDHIDRGMRSCPHSCPVALALDDAGVEFDYVERDIIRLPKGEVENPIEMWVRRYDNGDSVEPVEFELEMDADDC